jgi:hypothetical protein
MPLPWPKRAIKEIIRTYAHNHFAQTEWQKAVKALECLDKFLMDKRDNENCIRDQEVLHWCIDGLDQWGQRWEQEGTEQAWKAAIEYYDTGLKYTREAAQRRGNDKLTDSYITVALKLAQGRLNDDSWENRTSPVVQEGLNWCKEILELPECEERHQQQINELIHKRAVALADHGRWDQAHELIDALDQLFVSSLDKYQNCFADWQRELALNEVDIRLEQQQFDLAFERLGWLRQWFERYNAPQVTWSDTLPHIKKRINEVYQAWRKDKLWQAITTSLQILTDTIIPNDTDIMSWQVEAHYDWAQWLYDQKQYTESQAQCEQALRLEAGQVLITKDELEGLLFKAQLAKVKEVLALKQADALSEVSPIFKQIVQKQSEYPDHIAEIRQILKTYYEEQIQQESPLWEAIHQALYELGSLIDTKNEEIFYWRQQLTMQEMEANLMAAKSEQALAVVFANLKQPGRVYQLTDIKKVVRSYSQTWAMAIETGPLAISILQQMEIIRADSHWIAEELKQVGDLLRNQDKWLARQAYNLAHDFLNH